MQIKSLIDEQTFRARIHKRYERIKDFIEFDHNRNTATNKSSHELSKGCQICKRGSWLCLFVGLRCNASCHYCSRALLNKYGDEPDGFLMGMSFAELVEKIIEQGDKIEGVAYSGGEPLLYLDSKVIPIASILYHNKSSIYQWLYTNGILINEENLHVLRKAGVKELRLDLAATNFNDKIIAKIPMIKKIIGIVTIEVPSIPEVYEKLIMEKLIHHIAEQGIEQINLAEQYVTNDRAAKHMYSQEAYISSLGLLSPTRSRNITVDIIEYVIEHNIPLLVNDCSNDSKFQQASTRKYSIEIFKAATLMQQ